MQKTIRDTKDQMSVPPIYNTNLSFNLHWILVIYTKKIQTPQGSILLFFYCWMQNFTPQAICRTKGIFIKKAISVSNNQQDTYTIPKQIQ